MVWNILKSAKIQTYLKFVVYQGSYEQNSKHPHQARKIKFQIVADFYIVYNRGVEKYTKSYHDKKNSVKPHNENLQNLILQVDDFLPLGIISG